MNTVNQIYLPQLHNGENANFHRDSLEQLEKAGTDILGITAQYGAYSVACKDLQLTIDVFSVNKLSKESAELDNRRDRAYSALKAYIKVCLNEEDEAKARAAEQIITVVRQSAQEVGNPLTLGMIKESTALLSLLRNLEPLATEIEQIGATARLNQLKEANQAFIDIQFERYVEQGAKHPGDVKAARTVADATYKRIIDRINARILLDENPELTPYVNAQNAVVEKYKNLAAQRKGRKKSVNSDNR
jgi:hypothetical protein